MLDLIRKAVGLKSGAAPSVPDDRRRRTELIAAVFLLEAAHSDFECTDQELDHVIGTVKGLFGLTDEYVKELVELAHSERKRMVDIYEFTRRANEQMSRDEKQSVLEAVWRIIYADGRIDKYEEHFARKLTDLLFLEHRHFIEAKLKVRDERGSG